MIVRYPDTEDETLAVHIGSLLGVGHEWHVGERGHVLRQDREESLSTMSSYSATISMKRAG
ncbi:MAG: hypothetical protein IPK80_19745 [Nannocystis sp.]|nr:hypothetical protein [Nannocystis sp.]